MKVLYLFILSIFITPNLEASNQSSHKSNADSLCSENFHEQTFLSLLEEYQDYTKHKPKSPSEDPVISDFMKRLSAQTNHIETEIINTKLGLADRNQKSLARLKHYNSAAKTALKELQKRQGQVQFLKESNSILEQEISLAQNQKPALTAFSSFRESLLHSPLLTLC
ncbi:hypothetical protein FJ366_01635 [Candidatus Dependentiae bacterium]|nr:hypothetical protein [Candidatus Dependentiae bacterium]